MRLLIILMLFAVTWLNAQVPVGVFTERLYLDYKIQTTLLVSNEVLHHKIENGIIKKAQGVNKLKIHSDSNYTSEDVANEALLQSLINNSQVIAIVGSNQVYKFYTIAQLDSAYKHNPNAYQAFKETMVKVGRLHGLTAATVWFVSEFTQIIAVPVSAFLGAPHVGIMLVASPLSFINLAIALNVMNISHNIKLKNAYGGYKNKRLAERVQRKVKRTFGIRNENSILHQYAMHNDTQVYFGINRNNLFIDIGSFLKLNQHKAYFRNIKRFCKSNINNDTLNAILNNKQISKQMRCIFAIDYLYNFYPTLHQQLTHKFYKSVVAKPLHERQVYSNAHVKQWIYSLCTIKNLADAEPILRQFPSGLKVYEALELLDNIIIKHWAENMRKQDFKAFRRMVTGMRKTNYILLKQSDEIFTQQHVDVLLLNCNLL